MILLVVGFGLLMFCVEAMVTPLASVPSSSKILRIGKGVLNAAAMVHGAAVRLVEGDRSVTTNALLKVLGLTEHATAARRAIASSYGDAFIEALFHVRMFQHLQESPHLSERHVLENVRREIEDAQDAAEDFFLGFLQGVAEVAICMVGSFAKCQSSILTFVLTIVNTVDTFVNDNHTWVSVANKVWDVVVNGIKVLFDCGKIVAKTNWMKMLWKATKNAGKIKNAVISLHSVFIEKDYKEAGRWIPKLLGLMLDLCSGADTMRRAVSNTPPSSWTCPADRYGTGDGCDCNCGAVDPDCSTSDVVFGCAVGDNVQCIDGTCSVGKLIHPNWTCPHEWYNAGHGECRCGCGAHDPDCDQSYAVTVNCPCPKMTCDLDVQECIGTCHGHDFEDMYVVQNQGGGVNAGTVVSIVLGVAVAVLAVALLVVAMCLCWHCRRRSHGKNEKTIKSTGRGDDYMLQEDDAEA